MLVTWNPENGEDEQRWTFDPEDVLRKDAEKIETLYGEGWEPWLAALQVGSIKARSVLLWYMLYLVHPRLSYKDVPDFRVRQLKVEMGTLELKKLWERLSKMKMDEDRMETLRSAFEVDLKDAMVREGIDGNVEVVDGQLAITGVQEAPKEG